MSKSLRTLIAVLAVLVILIGAYFAAVNLIPQPEEDGTSSTDNSSTDQTSSSETTYIYNYGVDSFVSATVNAVSGTYTVVKESDGFAIPEIKDLTNYPTMIQSCAERLSAYPYLSIENTSPTEEEREEYGLNDPTATATVTFENATVEITVGAKISGGYYYMTVGGDDNVYIAATAINAYFIQGANYFVNTSLFYCYEDYRSGINDFVLVDKQDEDPVKISKNTDGNATAVSLSSTYCITYPSVMGVDEDALDKGLTELASFSAEYVVYISATEEQKAELGLSEPRYTLSFTYQKPSSDGGENTNPVESYKFYLSDVDENNYLYACADGSDTVYAIPNGAYGFIDWKMEDIAAITFVSPMIKYLDKMIVTWQGKEYEFVFTAGDGSISAVRYLDRQLDVDNFKRFYQVVLGTSRIGVGSAEPDAEEYLSVRFVYNESMNRADEVMTFKTFNARRYAVEINGFGRFTVAKTRVDKLTNDLKKVINGEEVLVFMN